MVKTAIAKVRYAFFLALLTSLWCWLLTALHGMWTFGVADGYFDGRDLPFYPYEPATYGTFFFCALNALVLPFAIVLALSIALPQRFCLWVSLTAWLAGAYAGASGTAFAFIMNEGATWRTWELIATLFIDPVVSPIYLFVGLAGLVFITRPLRGIP